MVGDQLVRMAFILKHLSCLYANGRLWHLHSYSTVPCSWFQHVCFRRRR